MESKILTRRQVAKELDISLGTLYNWERAGHLTPSRIGRRVYYSRQQLDRILGLEDE